MYSFIQEASKRDNASSTKSPPFRLNSSPAFMASSKAFTTLVPSAAETKKKGRSCCCANLKLFFVTLFFSVAGGQVATRWAGRGGGVGLQGQGKGLGGGGEGVLQSWSVVAYTAVDRWSPC